MLHGTVIIRTPVSLRKYRDTPQLFAAIDFSMYYDHYDD
jgi:hypothetical protein